MKEHLHRQSTTIAFGWLAAACSMLPLSVGCQSECGDGVWCPELEECDAGLPEGVECDSFCRAVGAVCGDGIVEDAEACDDGFTDACGTCNATCTGPGSGSSCGDGIVCPETEQCNLATLNPDLECVENCAQEDAVCGNRILEPGEFCDDGFTDVCGSCNADCSGLGADAQIGAEDIVSQSLADLLSSIVSFFLTSLINELFGQGSTF